MQHQEPLLSSGDGMDGAGSAAAHIWSGTIGNAPALLTLDPDGAFHLVEERSAETCFSRLWSPVDIKTSAEELVGATQSGASVQLWHMPLTNPGADRPVRALRQTPLFALTSPAEAAAVVAAARAAVFPNGPRHVLAIINPASGRGSAPKEWKNRCLPVLEAAGCVVTSHVTEARGHATEIVRAVDPADLDVILTLGGDGTTFEALQGLLARPDWADAAAAARLVQVPCGSGNALAASTDLWDVSTAIHAAIRGQEAPLDIASVVQVPGGRFFSFLSFTYGMISTLDLGTEHLRMLGGLRFVVGAVQQVMAQSTYRLNAAFLDADVADDDADGGGAGALLNAQNGGGDGLLRAPSAADGDVEEGAPVAAAVLAANTGASDGKTADLDERWLKVEAELGPGPSLRHFRRFAAVAATRGAAKHTASPPPTESTHPLPSRWHWMPAEEVQLWAACNLPRLDMNFLFAPEAVPSSGHMNLIYTSGRSGRRRGLELLTKSESGQHMDHPLVQQRRLRALWVEPAAEAGRTWLVVDGEGVEHAPLYAEVHTGLCTVLRPPRKVEETLSSEKGFK